MSPRQFRRIGMIVFGKKWKAAMARWLGVDRKTVYRWNAGLNPIHGGAALRVCRLERAWISRKTDAIDRPSLPSTH